MILMKVKLNNYFLHVRFVEESRIFYV